MVLTPRSFFSFAVSFAFGPFFGTEADLFEDNPVPVVIFAAYVVSASVNVVLSAAEIICISRALNAFLV